MIRIFKNNPLACGLLGVIVGSGGTVGIQSMIDNEEPTYVGTKYKEDETNFKIVPYDKHGDVYITAHGKRYHSEYCYWLRHAKRVQQVNSVDALKAGIRPCSKCQ